MTVYGFCKKTALEFKEKTVSRLRPFSTVWNFRLLPKNHLHLEEDIENAYIVHRKDGSEIPAYTDAEIRKILNNLKVKKPPSEDPNKYLKYIVNIAYCITHLKEWKKTIVIRLLNSIVKILEEIIIVRSQ